jgi:hypothetical protein
MCNVELELVWIWRLGLWTADVQRTPGLRTELLRRSVGWVVGAGVLAGAGATSCASKEARGRNGVGPVPEG